MKILRKTLPFVIIFLAIAVRAELYVDNCSVNTDEASIAVDVCGRSLSQIILNQLPYSDLPNRPLGLLIIYKILTILFGNAEWVFRLFPFICSLVSIFVFRKLTHIYVLERGRLFALLVFSFTQYLVFYSTSMKQYSSDILVVLLLYWMHAWLATNKLSLSRTRLFGLLGFLAIFFSYTSIFILTAVGLCHFLFDSFNRRWSKENIWLGGYWVIGFMLMYIKYFHYMTESVPIITSAQYWFWPISFSLDSLKWLDTSFMHVMSHPLGLGPEWLACLVFVLGVIVSIIQSKRNGLVLLLPIVFVLVASGFKKYPFFERYILFLVPALIMLLSQGIGWLLHKGRALQALGVAIGIALLFTPIKDSSRSFRTSECALNHREMMTYFQKNYQAGDYIYINNSTQYVFWYYGNTLGINHQLMESAVGRWNNKDIKGRTMGKIENHLRELKGKKYMVITYEQSGYGPDGIFLNKFTSEDPLTSSQIIYQDSSIDFLSDQRVWLMLLHSTPSITKFVSQKFTSHSKILHSTGQGHRRMYLLKMNKMP